MSTWACTVCRRNYAKGQADQVCLDCQRLTSYGAIVDVLDALWRGAIAGGTADYRRQLALRRLEALDALAAVMGTTTRLRRQHNRELLDEQLAAQRDSRAAFDDGIAQGKAWS